MLVEFRVENHRSLRDEQVLTMEAGRVGDETDPRPRHVPGHSEPLLTVAGLYGANASGKSNVVSALVFLREAVVMSHRSWPPSPTRPRDPIVPRDPFAWGPKSGEPSLFEVVFLIGGVRYQYGFRVSDDRFLEEWLFAWPSGKKQIWFEREDQDFTFGEKLKGENRTMEAVTRPNALFLSVAAQHHHPQLTPLFAWFQSLEVVNEPPRRHFQSSSSLEFTLSTDEDWQLLLSPRLRSQESQDEQLNRLRSLLREADVGVVDMRLVNEEDRTNADEDIVLRHQSEEADAWLPLAQESHGTRTILKLALPIVDALQQGGIVLVDELERGLHPSLARKIIEQFNDPAANPKNAQIIFTTHDTNLLGTMLGEPALRRDQVWLTEKDNTGATVLYPLTNYKPRKAENLERGYLQGRYGAIPFLSDYLVTAE